MILPEPEAVIFCGIQAAGKTTFYNRYFAATHRHISLDVLKTKHRQNTLLEECFSARVSFVLDNTNPTIEVRVPFLEAAQQNGFRSVGYYFRSSLNEVLTRNNEREEKQRVPPVGIFATHKKLQLPSYDEGFDELFYVSLNEYFEYSIEKWRSERNP